jgi:hypothetical protein
MISPNTNILDNLQVSTLIDWHRMDRTLKLTNGACIISADIDALNIDIPQGSKAINDLIYRNTFIGDDELVAEILNTNVVAGNLVVDLVPQNGNAVQFFRPDSLVFGNEKTIQGLVVSTTPGQIVVQPYAGSVIAQLFASFVVGDNVNYMGLSTPNRGSSGVDPIQYFPELQENYLWHTREGNAWYRTDKQNARIEYKNGFWEDGQTAMAIQRMLKAKERKELFGVAWADPSDATRYENGGIDWSIRNRGGVVTGFAAAPTQAQFQNFLDEVADRKTGNQKMKKMYMGRKLYQHIVNNFGSVNQPFIQQMNTVAGTIDMNAKYYLVGGHEVELVFNLPLFQDRNWDNVLTTGAGMSGMRKEWMCYYIDQDPILTVDGTYRPAIERIHHSVSPYYAAFGSGIGDQPIGVPLVEGATITPEALGVPMSMIDRSEVQVMYHGGIDMLTGQYSGVFFPTT